MTWPATVNLRAFPRPSVRFVVVAVTGVAVLGAGGDVGMSVGHQLVGNDPTTFWLLAGICVLTELRPLRWLQLGGDSAEVTSSWTFMMGMLMVATPLAGIGVAATLFLLGDLRARKSATKVVFNVAQIVVALSIGAAVLRVAGPIDALQDPGGPSLLWYPIAALACIGAFAVNTLLTCTVVALHQHLPLRSIVDEHGITTLPTDAMLLALAPVFVVVVDRSPWLIVPLLATTGMVYRTARLALARQHETTHDQLTQLVNRSMFFERLAESVESARRAGGRVGVVLIDLDEFKGVNDGLGHHVGDHVLRLVAARMNEACRDGDVLARLGGDEFAMILPSVETVEDAAGVATRMLGLFERPLKTDGFPIVVKASAGVAVFPDHGDSADILVHRADEAMYSAKRTHSGALVYQPGEDATGIGRLGLLADLVGAMADDELFLEYQPQIELLTGDVVGVEALVRWRHPTIGLIPPVEFMPLAEQTDLIGPLTGWIMRKALLQCASWRRDGRSFRLAVNISVRNLLDIGFVQTVIGALDAVGLRATDLLLEITENTVALDRSTARNVLGELRALGVAVSIDDFGTGYSSISQLRDLPVDQVKLDRLFVSDMADDPRDALLVQTMVQLGSALGLETVAEGVEDARVLAMLRELGCSQAQGYFIARPMAADALSGWLDSRTPQLAAMAEFPPIAS